MHLMPGGYGGVDPERVRAARAGLDELERSAQALPADTFGRICSIAGTNQYFSMPSLTELIARLRWAISVAPQVIACSDELVREYARRSANGRG